MITPGHIAASYLLAESAKNLGIPLNSNQVLAVILVGNIIDLDFVIGLFTRKTGELHHQNITHTPLGILGIWLAIFILFRTTFVYSLVLLISLFLHLVLDDLGRLMKNPQINWLYPIKPFSSRNRVTNNREVLINYLTKFRPVALFEVLLVITAMILFVLRFNS